METVTDISQPRIQTVVSTQKEIDSLAFSPQILKGSYCPQIQRGLLPSQLPANLAGLILPHSPKPV